MMQLELVVGESTLERPITIEQLPPGNWKFGAYTCPFFLDSLEYLSPQVKDILLKCYPLDTNILKQFFDGDPAVWSQVRPGGVPQAFFYSLVDESQFLRRAHYSPYLPASVFAPKISPRWENINTEECRSRQSLFFTKLYKYSVKSDKIEMYNKEVVDFFELYYEKYDIITSVDISVNLKKILQAPVFITEKCLIKDTEDKQKRSRWEFSHHYALGKSLCLPEAYRTREAINKLFPNISELTFYEIEESDFDGSGPSNYCGLSKVLNFNLIELMPAWSQNLTTLNYIITRKWGNLDAYKGNLRKLLQIANSCPKLVDFSLGLPYTQEGSVNLVNSKGRKVGDWSFISRLTAFQISYPLVSKGPQAEQNQSSNQSALVNIFKRLDPKKLVDFGLHITGRPRLWMEVLHRLQDHAPEVFKKINKLRLPENSPNTRPDFIMLACQCFQLKYLDFYLHNHHNDFTMLAKLQRSLVTLILRCDTELVPIGDFTMNKMPVFWNVTTVRIATSVGSSDEVLPRTFVSRTFPNAKLYLSIYQIADSNILTGDLSSRFVAG